jgi:PPOX class probable FMN-dependent enzyme
MQTVSTISALEALYGTAAPASLRKVATHLTPGYRRWIMASKLCVFCTVGPEGVDASPRGDDGPVVLELDANTLALPDWRGNNRLDSLRNIIEDGRVALMFMVAGSNNVVRVNGRAVLTDDADLRQRFARQGRTPVTVAVISITEIYFQCARALLRAGLWAEAGQTPDVPSAGDLLAEQTGNEINGTVYDADWAARAAKTMW